MSYRTIFRAGLFNDRVLIVTGAGSGIGRCTAHELAALGAVVALVGRKVEKLIRVADEITAAGGRSSVHVCDIRDEPAVRQTVSDVLAAAHESPRAARAGGAGRAAGRQVPRR